MNSKAHTGACGELFVIQYFLEQGYEVFHNVAPAGPIDVVIFKDGKFIPIDVKSTTTAYTRTDGSTMLNIKVCRREDGVWQLGYNHQTKEIHFPEGFWEEN
jgi:Holliday junction resolvase-like predicted endonuclease